MGKTSKRRRASQKPVGRLKKPTGCGRAPATISGSKQQQQQQQQTMKKEGEKKKKKTSKGERGGSNAQHQRPEIPFSPEEAILLVGEGDLSFAASLVEHHGCANVTATVLEASLDELAAKYPNAGANADKISAGGGRVVYGVDTRTMRPFARGRGPGAEGAMDRVMFNFPHVGGKSTDVNRQVRHNQEMLVAFLRRAQPSMAPGATVVVTLFEGEPYTLWNVRDLARSVGLQVERSFAFCASAYPGYRHARTLGVVRSRKGDVGGGWKGEQRPARSYVFARKGDVAKPVARPQKKRKRGDESSDEEGEEGSGKEEEGGSDEEEEEEGGIDDDQNRDPDD